MENILQNMFEFLKNNNIINNSNVDCNVTNEIYIDLYFYLENEKFMNLEQMNVQNVQIGDLLKYIC